jgi:opacity protein-like surface antigen
MKRLVLALAVAAPAFVTTVAAAAPPWVDRPMTLPNHVFAGDVGIGVGHIGTPGRDFTGPGINLEGAFGITDRVELGLRTGFRLGDDARVTQADDYARTLWTETYGTLGDAVANPEFRVRWTALTTSVVELGLDGRLVIPVEANSEPGVLFGVPLAFHIGSSARIDTGGYVGSYFYSPTAFVFTVPGYFWFQVGDKFWLGPMAAFRHFELGNRGVFRVVENRLLVGAGFGYQVASAVDLKWMFFWPRINQDRGGSEFGAGFGVQFRIE